MAVLGYARASPTDRNLDLQERALKAAGCEFVRAETVTGTKRASRTELAALLEFLRKNDTLIVTRIDRLARSVKDLRDIVHELRAKGVDLKATEQPIDTSTAAGRYFWDMLGVFAEFETNLQRERQLEGVAAAKARGIYKGRKATIDPAQIRRLAADGLGTTAICKQLKVSRTTVYRLLETVA